MRRRLRYLIGAGLLLAAAGGTHVLLGLQGDRRVLAELVRKTRDSLVYVEGGSFSMGNYQTRFRTADGQSREDWVGLSATAPSREVALDSFYISSFETSYADFNIFLSAQGLPRLKPQPDHHLNLPDRAASLSLEEATKYCAWLGQEAGLTMRLPTEAEWEYAARSRGQTPPWATDDGNLEPGRNVAANGRDLPLPQRDPPIGALPPNPLGLYNLADGLYEWVSDRAADDPAGSGIFKGGSNFSDRFYERIPGRGVVERESQATLDRLLAIFPDAMKDRLMRHDDPLAPGSANTAARCIAEEARQPDESGFGRLPAPVVLSAPFGGQQ